MKERRQQGEARAECDGQPDLAGAVAILWRQSSCKDGDEHDIVDAEDDLERCQRDEGDPGFGTGEEFHGGVFSFVGGDTPWGGGLSHSQCNGGRCWD